GMGFKWPPLRPTLQAQFVLSSRPRGGELEKVSVAFPNWSRNGNYVYFHSSGSDATLYRVRVSNRELEKIVSLRGIRLTIGAIGTWCGLTPDDSPLVLRDVGTQEIYALDLQFP